VIRIEEKTIWKWFLHRLAIYKPTFWTCLSSIMVVHHGSSSNFLVLSSDRVCSSSSWWWFACDDKNNTKRTRLWTGIHGTAGDFDRFGHLASRKNRFAASVAPSVCFSRSASFIPCSSAVEGSCHSCILWRSSALVQNFPTSPGALLHVTQIPWMEKWAENGTVRYGKPRWPSYGPKTVSDDDVKFTIIRDAPHNPTS